MKATARIGKVVLLCGSALVLNALWLVGFGFSLGSLPEDRPTGYGFDLVVVLSVLSTPWMVAVGLLSRAWRTEAGASSSSMDPPARLLAVATATLPEGRRDWGMAMTAELAQVQARSARWRFAVGCAWVAIFPPRSDRGSVVGAAALGAVAVSLTGFTVGETFPSLQVFAMTFVGLIGAAAVVTVARSRPLPRPGSGPVVAAGITGVASCMAATWYIVDQYPMAAVHLQTRGAIILAAILACALWLIVAPPRALTGDRLAGHLALDVALVLALGLLQASRAELRGSGTGIFNYVFFIPIAAIFATAAVVAALRQSLWAGVQATVWAALLTSVAFFAIAVTEAVHWYQAGAGLILDGEAIPRDAAVGMNIRNFTGFLVLLPFFWTPFGVIGAAIGRAGRARLSRAG
jgi:hypothetical protein